IAAGAQTGEGFSAVESVSAARMSEATSAATMVVAEERWLQGFKCKRVDVGTGLPDVASRIRDYDAISAGRRLTQ
ncbi:MAG: hypothetical protein WAN93_01105, partial [Solirubrobacteraceae bacterium]